jgi:hypothetical protein
MSSVRSFGRLGKQFHRLPNICLDVITDVGLDEASQSYRAVSRNKLNNRPRFVRLGFHPNLLPCSAQEPRLMFKSHESQIMSNT